MQLDTDAGARVLFAETFAGTLPIFPHWDQQPEAFKNLMRERARVVTQATLGIDPDLGLELPPPA